MKTLYGKLALEAGYYLANKVCKSGAGYYIGTWSEEGPCSRESEEYFRTRKEAENALQTENWTQRDSVKTAFTDDLISIAKLLAQN